MDHGRTKAGTILPRGFVPVADGYGPSLSTQVPDTGTMSLLPPGSHDAEIPKLRMSEQACKAAGELS